MIAAVTDRLRSFSRHLTVFKAALETERERDAIRRDFDNPEFLPAALEVVETPPSPMGRALLWFLIASVAIALMWSILGRIDVVAVAPGQLIPAGRSKVIQASELGTVRAVHVREGSFVRVGDLLIELDPTSATTDESQARETLLAAQVDAARARAILSGLRGESPNFVAPAGTPPELAAVQARLVQTALAEHRARLEGLSQERASAVAQASAARQEVLKLQETTPLLQRQVEARRQLAARGYTSRLQLLEYESALLASRRGIAVARENERQAGARVDALAQNRSQQNQQMIRDTLTALAEAENRAALAREALTRTARRTSLHRLVAPVTGTVQQLSVSTIGGVVQPAQPLMTIVPRSGTPGSELVAEVQVLNRDIGFIREGQNVAVKLEAFPFTDYGMINGRLVAISREAVRHETLGLVYTARVALDCGDGASPEARNLCERITPGMALSAEIRTGTRRIIDYLLSPISQTASEAGRER